MNYQQEPIAIIGLGCRFPGGANSHKAFWRLLTQGKDAIIDVPADRWDIRRFYDPDPDKPGKVYVKQGGFLKEKIYDFDPLFFGISPREAESMDPQQRLLLEVTWEAFEDAGLIIDELSGPRTGVFIGGFTLDNLLIRLNQNNQELTNSHTGSSCTMTILSNRISHVFNLQGPSVTMDTACSSSLVTTHYACQSLLMKECDTAVVGGVNIILGPEYSLALSKGRFLSRHGRCMAFDERAEGYTRAEGAGVAVLRPLSKALENNDHIYALIKMSGVNQDGHTQGISMPNSRAQEDLIREVYKKADISPGKVGYVEAHGTGTKAGDPKEILALHSVLSEDRSEKEISFVGSVKSNIGHLEAGAGIAGLTKAALCLKHNKIPPNLHFETPNPDIPFEDMCLRVPTALVDWPEHNGTRYAGVNSFGYGGTNAHVLLQEAPLQAEPKPVSQWDKPYLVPVSARSEGALRALAGKYAFFLTSQTGPRTLADFLYTVTQRRSHHPHRLTLIANSQDELREKLQLFSTGDYVEYSSSGFAQEQNDLVFIYTGMGPQWWAMGRELMEQEPTFLKTIQECDELFQKIAGWSILETLQRDEENSEMTRTEVAQPANFVIQIALTALWRERGILPDAIIGHSVGEVAAAYVSGALSLEDAVKVSIYRSQLQAKTVGNGTMLAIGLTEKEASELTRNYDQVSIGAINSPSGVTLSGNGEQLEQIAEALEKNKTFNRKLDVEVAYHSPQMESIKEELLESLASISPTKTQYPLYSTVTGKLIDGSELAADYWWQNVREPVRFADGIHALIEKGLVNFLEIGPHPVLAHSVKEVAGEIETKVNLICSLNRKFPEQTRMLESLGELYNLGHKVDWQSIIPAGGQFVPVPTYPWQKERYWNESAESSQYRLGQAGYVYLNNKLALPNPTWEVELNNNFFPFLADHIVHDEIVFPGMGYVEAGLAAYKACLENSVSIISELQIRSMLFIAPKQVQTLRLEYNQTTKRFAVHSREKTGDSQWKLHASGKFISHHYNSANTTIDLESLKDHIDNGIDTQETYAKLAIRGLSYGPAFQTIKELRIAENEILVNIIDSHESADTSSEKLLPPPLTDAALQSILSIVPGDAPYVPVYIGKVVYYQPPQSSSWCHAQITQRNAKSFEADYYFYDDEGKLLVEFRSVLHQEMIATLQHKENFLENSLYEPIWIDYKSEFATIETEIKDCLIFAHESEIYSEIKEALEEKNISNIRVFNGTSFKQLTAYDFVINGNDKSDFKAIFEHLKNKSISHIFFLWPLSKDMTTDLDSILSNCTQLTFLAQEIDSHSENPVQLIVFNQKSQNVTAEDRELNLNSSPLWGLGQLIKNEHPNIQCRLIDLDNTLSTSKVENWLRYLTEDHSTDIAFRNGKVYIKKLVRLLSDEKQEKANKKQVSTNSAARLEVEQKGQLDSFFYHEVARLTPEANEIEIKVHYSALNFKDVLKAYGTISPKVTDGTYFGSSIGMEVAGRVISIGKDVKNFEIGDEVVAPVRGAFQTYVTVPTDFVVNKAKNVRLEEYFVHIGYLTAYHALINLASLNERDKILIHSATGGLGLAAIQIAKWVGAEIFVTAGTHEKREYLKSLDIKHVFDSRSLNFADDIKVLTGGYGVDVVLNALSGESLIESLNLLAPYGRFIEAGKQDISENNDLPMEVFNRNITFASIDLDRMYKEKPELLKSILEEVNKGFEKGHFHPINTTVYPASEISEAFRYMGQGKHIGKIVVKYDNEFIEVATQKKNTDIYKNNASYIITGGTSGFGLEVAKWLGKSNVGKLILISRSGVVTNDAKKVVSSLREKGISVDTPRLDISDSQAVKELVNSIDNSNTPLKGVFHGAMVLDDGLLRDMNSTRFKSVMTPKVLGAINLYKSCQDLALDFFVMFSSIASLVGNRGQANYIAANSFLDEYAHALKLKSFPALSINWGVLAETGIAARNSEVSELLTKEGVYGLTNEEALLAMDRLIGNQKTQAGVLNVDWFRWGNVDPNRKNLTRFSDLMQQEKSRDSINLKAVKIVEEISTLSDDEKLKYVENILKETVAKILKLTPNKIDVNQDIGILGIDSLMFMELTLTAQDTFGITLTTMELMKEPVISDFAKTVLDKLFFLI